MASLAETFELVKQAEFESKLASLQELWGNDEKRLALMDEALEIIKEAQEAGELPALDEAQILDLSVALVEDAIEEEAPEAEAKEEAPEEIEKEASEEDLKELYELGQEVGKILAENDISAEDLQKIASEEEEAEELGRACAQELVRRYSEVEKTK